MVFMDKLPFSGSSKKTLARGKLDSAYRYRKKELVVRRIRAGGKTGDCHSESFQHCQAEWLGSLCLAEGHAGEIAGLAQ
jgi:hypothetical protein